MNETPEPTLDVVIDPDAGRGDLVPALARLLRKLRDRVAQGEGLARIARTAEALERPATVAGDRPSRLPDVPPT